MYYVLKLCGHLSNSLLNELKLFFMWSNYFLNSVCSKLESLFARKDYRTN